MFKSWLLRTLVITFLIIQASTQINGQNATQKVRCGKGPIDISLIALIASPQKYDMCIVRVMGVINVGFEGEALFLHEEDYKYGLMKNSLRLHLSDVQIEKFKKYNGSHVILEGIFYGVGPDSRESTSGAIANITRLDSWGPD